MSGTHAVADGPPVQPRAGGSQVPRVEIGDRRTDPRLKPFRRPVAELTVGGTVAGHLATRVERFWSWRRPLALQDQLLERLTRTDGRQDWSQEDRLVDFSSGMQGAVFYWEPDDDETVEYSVKWLEGAAHDAAREEFASDWWEGYDSYLR